MTRPLYLLPFAVLGCGGDDPDPSLSTDDTDTSLTMVSSASTGDTGGTVAGTASTANTASTAHTARPTGTTGATASTADTASTSTGSTGDTGAGLVAVLGATCERDALVGAVEIYGFGTTLYVSGAVFDGPDPTIGPPVIDNGACAHHTMDTSACGMCATGFVCGAAGQCVTPPTLVPATLELSAGGGDQLVDGPKGTLYAEVTVGGPSDLFSGVLRFSGLEVAVPAMGYASGELGSAVVRIDSDFASPGPLLATWDAPTDGGVVSSLIPINHHVQHPTFTWCEVEASDESFLATEPMIDPLAVSTGLEFQGLWHHQVAAADTPLGCVEFRYGPQLYVSPTY